MSVQPPGAVPTAEHNGHDRASASPAASTDLVVDGPDQGGGDGMPLSGRGCMILGALLISIGVISLYSLIAIWPAVEAATTPHARPAHIQIFGIPWTPRPEVALLLLVTFASALGSSLHASISFTDYVGNRRLAASWVWWYVLRTFVGVALAVLFYFALRGGLFSGNTPAGAINPFGIGALAGLVGLFSKQATDKLREIFDTMFRTAPGQGDDQRGDSIVNPKPRVGGAAPSTLRAGGEPQWVKLSGDGFIPQSLVRVTRSKDGRGPFVQRATQFGGPHDLRVQIDPDDMKPTGVLYLTVVNPPPGGGQSGVAEVEIQPSEEPAAAAGAAAQEQER